MRLPIRLVGRDVLFAHWPVASDALAGYVPDPLSLDTYDGAAWVSVLALRAKPAVRGVPTVPQVLFRTYVSHDGERGVRFLTCDSAGGLGGLSERPFGLPLRRARIDLDRRGEAFVVRSRRLGGEAARFEALGLSPPASAPVTAYCPRFEPRFLGTDRLG